MRQSPETRERMAGGSRSTAHFRGWFLALVVLGWLGGWALVWWRGLPGVLALAGVVLLLLVADARGLFTLRGRLPWGRTGTMGRALLVVLVLALLPLVVTLYLLGAMRRYARARRPGGRRIRAESIPVALAAESSIDGGYLANDFEPPTEEAPTTRPLPSSPSPPPLGQWSATSRPSAQANSSPLADDAPLFLAGMAPEGGEEMADAGEDGSQNASTPRHAGWRRGGLLVGFLAAGAALLLVSCGLLAYAGPARGLLAARSSSGGKQISTSGAGDTTSPSAANASAPGANATGGQTPTATASASPTVTASASPTPTATPTAAAKTAPTPSGSAATPTPKPTHAPGKHTQPKAPAKHPRPTPPAVPGVPPWVTGAQGGPANPFGLTGPLQVVFTCAPDQLAAFDHVCFIVPPGSQVEAVIHARCVAPYAATLDARHTIAPDGQGTLAWSWRPSRECQTGSVRVTLRLTLDGFTSEVPVREYSVGG